MLIIGLIGVGTGILLVYLQFQFSAEQSAFRSAVSCITPQTAITSESCTYTGPATVTGSHHQVRLFVDMTFAAMPGRSFTTSFSTQREPPAASVATGTTAMVQLWNGKVTRFAGIGTADDPEYLPTNSLGPGLIFAAVGLGVSAAGIYLARRAWRR